MMQRKINRSETDKNIIPDKVPYEDIMLWLIAVLTENGAKCDVTGEKQLFVCLNDNSFGINIKI